MNHSQLDQGVPSVSLEVLRAATHVTLVDLRSPAEFADDHLPGAVNVPLLDDQERAVVGTLYHREGREAAFREGRELVQGRVVELVARLQSAAGNRGADPLDPRRMAERVGELTFGGMARMEADLALRPKERVSAGCLVLYCWRGGLRSRSVAALLRDLGVSGVLVLDGGYRSWRKAVRDGLAEWSEDRAHGTFVLRGLTGVGKTLVLREIERLRPGWTVDLEGLAGHRSSLLGMVGLEPVSQKTFETALWTRLGERGPGPLVLEGESRKVGDVEVPVRLWRALCAGRNIVLEAPLERRVQVLMDDYLAPATDREQLGRQLESVGRRMGPEHRILELWRAGESERMVRELLIHYYDPLYGHSEEGRSRVATVQAADPLKAAQDVLLVVGG